MQVLECHRVWTDDSWDSYSKMNLNELIIAHNWSSSNADATHILARTNPSLLHLSTSGCSRNTAFIFPRLKSYRSMLDSGVWLWEPETKVDASSST